MKKAIIDADSLIWVAAYHLKEMEPDLLGIQACHAKVDQQLAAVLNRVGATHWMAFVGSCKSSSTFRHKLAQNRAYKGSRPSKPDFMKVWEAPIRAYVCNVKGFHVCEGIEADDAVRVMMEEHPDAVLCCTDKDLKQVTGQHYNMQKKVFYSITADEAAYNLYWQMLVGDTSDNIEGIPGIGPKTADKLLAGIPAQKLRYAVLYKFCEYYGEYMGTARFWETFALVRMLGRNEAEAYGFSPPQVWNSWMPQMSEMEDAGIPALDAGATAEDLLGSLS